MASRAEPGHDPIRVGVAGLSRAFTLMAPTFTGHPGVRLVAAADPRAEARAAFTARFGGVTYAEVAAMCADPEVDLVYVASPHQFHLDHAVAAFAHGRHVLVEKPMALTLDECDRMIAAAEAARCHLLVGHSHSFDLPYLRTAALIASGIFGALRMVTAMNFTDFMYRPRRPEELSTATGGGVIYSQAAHHVDIARLLAGGRVKSVRAAAGIWDAGRPTEGAYQAMLAFDSGAAASLIYSGYGHFDSDEMLGWVGELGQRKNPESHGESRRRLADARDGELALKEARAFGVETPASSGATKPLYNHFGVVIASCEQADFRPVADGIHIYGDREKRFERLETPAVPRGEVIDEILRVVRGGETPVHSGEWGRATLEVCLGIIESARDGREVAMSRQISLPATFARSVSS